MLYSFHSVCTFHNPKNLYINQTAMDIPNFVLVSNFGIEIESH